MCSAGGGAGSHPRARAWSGGEASLRKTGKAQQAPGQLLTHYSPDIPTFLVTAHAASARSKRARRRAEVRERETKRVRREGGGEGGGEGGKEASRETKEREGSEREDSVVIDFAGPAVVASTQRT